MNEAKLSEKGEQEFMELLAKFKREMKQISDHVIGDLYSEVLPYIESDAWLNYREHLRLEVQNKYINKETLTSDEAWAKFIREAIFVQFREELEQGIIRDQQTKIAFLEKCLDDRRRL